MSKSRDFMEMVDIDDPEFFGKKESKRAQVTKIITTRFIKIRMVQIKWCDINYQLREKYKLSKRKNNVWVKFKNYKIRNLLNARIKQV